MYPEPEPNRTFPSLACRDKAEKSMERESLYRGGEETDRVIFGEFRPRRTAVRDSAEEVSMGAHWVNGSIISRKNHLTVANNAPIGNNPNPCRRKSSPHTRESAYQADDDVNDGDSLDGANPTPAAALSISCEPTDPADPDRRDRQNQPRTIQADCGLEHLYVCAYVSYDIIIHARGRPSTFPPDPCHRFHLNVPLPVLPSRVSSALPSNHHAPRRTSHLSPSLLAPPVHHPSPAVGARWNPSSARLGSVSAPALEARTFAFATPRTPIRGVLPRPRPLNMHLYRGESAAASASASAIKLICWLHVQRPTATTSNVQRPKPLVPRHLGPRDASPAYRFRQVQSYEHIHLSCEFIPRLEDTAPVREDTATATIGRNSNSRRSAMSWMLKNAPPTLLESQQPVGPLKFMHRKAKQLSNLIRPLLCELDSVFFGECVTFFAHAASKTGSGF
ncbi:hypothetical protein C8R43DRAFT_1206985 [Mycena crocata]|nr:hypothetical protein C8R43DRAFT_1206985 [Mycena crocata]